MQIIFLRPELKKAVAEKKKCSIQYVCRALKGTAGDTRLAFEIREAALKMGGVREPRPSPFRTCSQKQAMQTKKDRDKTKGTLTER
jgi:hypothetical protein